MQNIVVRLAVFEERIVDGQATTYLTKVANNKLKEIWHDGIVGTSYAKIATNEATGEKVEINLFTRNAKWNLPNIAFIPPNAALWVEHAAEQIEPF